MWVTERSIESECEREWWRVCMTERVGQVESVTERTAERERECGTGMDCDINSHSHNDTHKSHDA